MSDERGTGWSIASLVLAVCATGILLVAPIYQSGSEEAVQVVGHPASHTRYFHNETAVQGNDPGSALVLLLVPLVLTAIPVLLRHQPRVRAVRTIAFVGMLFVLPFGYFTIGLFYLPSTVMMLLAVTRGRSGHARDRGEPRRNVAME